MLKLGNHAIDMGCPLNFRAILSSKLVSTTPRAPSWVAQECGIFWNILRNIDALVGILHWIYVFTVFGGEAENIVYTLYLDCICSVFGALYLLCIWSEARYIVYTLYLELLGLYIQSRLGTDS